MEFENMKITSVNNIIVKQTKSLKQKKFRDETGFFVVEGERALSDIPHDWNISYFILSERFVNSKNFNNKNFDIETYNKRAKVYFVSDQVFEKISDAITPQGVLAVCVQKKYNLSDMLVKENAMLLILENTQDPGNVGTMLRIADAAGASGVILSKNCVDIYNPKALRAAAGSIFHIPVFQNIDIIKVLQTLKNAGFMTYAAHLNTEIFPYSIDFTKNYAIIIGNEANGLSQEVCNCCDSLVKIPIIGMAESLNASVAGGILLYEAVRQRLFCKNNNA